MKKALLCLLSGGLLEQPSPDERSDIPGHSSKSVAHCVDIATTNRALRSAVDLRSPSVTVKK
jgi:hypothetical protein